MSMNLALQRHTVEKKLRNRGINPDRIDLEAELDSTLSLPENIQNLEEKYGKLERTGRNFRGRRDQARKSRRDQAKREARQFNKQRPEYNRYVDATKDAEKTFADPTERQMKKWKNNPNQYDMKGVDDRKPREERPQTELPFKRRRDKILYQAGKGEMRKSMREIPASIRRNTRGRRKAPKKVGPKDTRPKVEGVPEIAVSDSDIYGNKAWESMKKDRQRVMDKEEMLKFEREERLEADSGSRASEILKDSREIGTVGKKMKGTTTERSKQESLRDGYASKKSEKTLNKWEDNYI